MQYRILRVALALIVAAFLTACGGGSSSGSGGDDTGNPGETGNTGGDSVAITQSNADQVAGSAVATANNSVDSADTGQTGLTVSGAGALDTDADLVGYTLAVLDAAEARVASGIAKSDTFTTSCAGGGSITFETTDADGSGDISAGDSISITYSSCVSDGTTANGSVSVTYTDVGSSSAEATFTFNNLTFDDGTDTSLVDGSYTISYEETGTNEVTLRLSSSSLTMESGGSSAVVSDYDFTYVLNTSSNAFSWTYQATLESEDIGGQITINTTTPFTGTAGSNPSSGVMVVTGANDSSVTVTAIDSSTVELTIDENGDGQVDQTVTTSWTNLEDAYEASS